MIQARENAPSSDRKLAAAVHLGAVFFPFMAPIVGLVLAGRSRYVRFHALTSLIGQVLLSTLIITITIISLGHSIWSAYETWRTGAEIQWLAILLKPLALWLAFGLFSLINTLGELRRIPKTINGEDWGGRGLADRWARKITGAQNFQPQLTKPGVK